MTNQDVFKKDGEYISHTYQRFPIAVKCGHGASAEDFDGNRYIDFGSGIGTNFLGFCNEGWVKAVSGQLGMVQHTSNLFYTLPDVMLAERLCRETGLMILTAKTKLRIMPPLNITMDEIDRGLDILRECLSRFGGCNEA